MLFILKITQTMHYNYQIKHTPSYILNEAKQKTNN